MVDADRFVSGANVDVRLLVGTLVGGIAISIWTGLLTTISEIQRLLGEILTSPLDALTELIKLAFAIPSNAFGAAWRSAAEFVTGAVSVIGPAAYVLSIVIVVGTLWTLDYTLETMGVV